MHIVLFQPEIPDNTGNIGRTCVATGSTLHLIRPLGFDISEKAVRRAGLDYWKDLKLHVYDSYDEFLEHNGRPAVYMATTKAEKTHVDVTYTADSFVMFGRESTGIPEELLVTSRETCIRIPMRGGIRSLNLSNSVAVVVYEAMRQQGFSALETSGKLSRLRW